MHYSRCHRVCVLWNNIKPCLLLSFLSLKVKANIQLAIPNYLLCPRTDPCLPCTKISKSFYTATFCTHPIYFYCFFQSKWAQVFPHNTPFAKFLPSPIACLFFPALSVHFSKLLTLAHNLLILVSSATSVHQFFFISVINIGWWLINNGYTDKSCGRLYIVRNTLENSCLQDCAMSALQNVGCSMAYFPV